MKKVLAFAVASWMTLGAMAQTNLQVFYDFGKDRKQITTTFEMFKQDKWGDTFFFIDHDFRTKSKDGHLSINAGNEAPCGTYFEIARGLNFWQNTKLAPFSLHVEYNGGVYDGFYVNNAWLFGVNYFMHSPDFKNTLTLQALYKTIAKAKSDVPMQFTVVWGMNDLFGVDGLSFSGFADFWWQDHAALKDNGAWVSKSTTFISEPQIWYNVGRHFGCENLNIGGEVEFSNDFGTYDGFKCNPCLGIKWNF